MFPTFGAENFLVNSITTLNGEAIDFKAYRNPAQNAFNLEVREQKEQERTVMVYDIYGQLIYENKITKHLSIQTSEWASGMYIVSIDGASLKMVVN